MASHTGADLAGLGKITMRHLAFATALGLAALSLGACATTPRFQMPSFNPCADVSIGLYFESLSAEIGPEARAALKGAARQTRGCNVKSIDVLGLADPVGALDANQKLSEDRALAVSDALHSLGLTGMNLAAAGETGSVTSGGAVAPLRRRVDILIRLERRRAPPGS
jgi:hypothetical protein